VSTLAELRAALRVALKDGDPAAGYMWSDDQLNRFLSGAVWAYGWYFPRELSTSFAVVAGQASYPLPPGCNRVVRVDLVAPGNSEEEALVEGGDAHGWGYRVFGGALMLTRTPRSALGELLVGYLGAHEELASDEAVSSVPAADEEMLLSMAAASAVRALALDEAKRAQFESRSSRHAIEVAAVYSDRWESAVRAKRQRIRTGKLSVR
jgi:hypothetical protein